MNEKELLEWYISNHYYIDGNGKLTFKFNGTYEIEEKRAMSNEEDNKKRKQAIELMKTFVTEIDEPYTY